MLSSLIFKIIVKMTSYTSKFRTHVKVNLIKRKWLLLHFKIVLSITKQMYNTQVLNAIVLSNEKVSIKYEYNIKPNK